MHVMCACVFECVFVCGVCVFECVCVLVCERERDWKSSSIWPTGLAST